MRRLKLSAKQRDSISRGFAFLKPADLPKPLESDILPGIIKFLRVHPLVGWAARINSGGAENAQGQYVRFNDIIGCSDVIGQMRSGAFLAIEVKRPGEKPTPKQHAFLGLVQRFGGCSGWCTSIDGAIAILNAWARAR